MLKLGWTSQNVNLPSIQYVGQYFYRTMPELCQMHAEKTCHDCAKHSCQTLMSDAYVRRLCQSLMSDFCQCLFRGGHHSKQKWFERDNSWKETYVWMAASMKTSFTSTHSQVAYATVWKPIAFGPPSGSRKDSKLLRPSWEAWENSNSH